MHNGAILAAGKPAEVRGHPQVQSVYLGTGRRVSAARAPSDTTAAEPLQVRIGVATGLVAVGDLIGSGTAQEQAIVGDTPNLAVAGGGGSGGGWGAVDRVMPTRGAFGDPVQRLAALFALPMTLSLRHSPQCRLHGSSAKSSSCSTIVNCTSRRARRQRVSRIRSVLVVDIDSLV